ncbi:DUF177 domain-containing protein [Phormidium sp. CLA17]|uniref:YceD family protein n=1 Tax=Leptolyngbya sp. Cla-17 TaxID=2803751 RepID=UPI001491FCD8|nr:YceD family protein [Leptolyngbya sp. Cla-17]MBM0741922.1 DUF177 domain-containing protein [Leptolyngbya sp. Cla-17]
MEPIYIPRLTRLPEQIDIQQIDEVIPELGSLTPVKGLVRVKHQGNYLEVSGRAEAIITLTCDRCLQQYNYRLSITPSELIWLDETAEEFNQDLLDRDLSSEDLVESLSPEGYFDPTKWLYEQLCLEIPLRKLCDQQCEGISVPQSETNSAVDRRWAGLEAFKDQLFSQN